ncbi:MAG: hypothetical protein J7L71_05535 [Spirochaetaceae bacterium]|nr:hypothetical protein [Spirochaetaceae bacterium]
MKKIKWIAVSLVILIAFSSCTTMKVVPKERAIERFIELYNSGDAEKMTEMTSVPMLIDGEIVARTSDANFFWTRLAEAGFKFDGSEYYTIEPVTNKSSLIFGDTMEVATFFDKYVPPTAVLVRLSGPGGDFILLLSGRKGRYPFIFGFTGPLS